MHVYTRQEFPPLDLLSPTSLPCSSTWCSHDGSGRALNNDHRAAITLAAGRCLVTWLSSLSGDHKKPCHNGHSSEETFKQGYCRNFYVDILCACGSELAQTSQISNCLYFRHDKIIVAEYNVIARAVIVQIFICIIQPSWLSANRNNYYCNLNMYVQNRLYILVITTEVYSYSLFTYSICILCWK